MYTVGFATKVLAEDPNGAGGMTCREEGPSVGFGGDYFETKMFSLWLKETLEMLSAKSPPVRGGLFGRKS